MSAGVNTEYCSFTKAVEYLGDRWCLLILRELAMTGPQGFNALAAAIPGHISRSILTDRLRRLLDLGVVSRVGKPHQWSCQVHHVQMLLSGRFAVQMDDGEYVEITPNEVFDVPPGHDAWVVGDEPAVLLDFLGNAGELGLPSSHNRVVTTLLMTDIVDSTATASRLGDVAWKQLLGEHNRIVRLRLERYGAQEVNTTGDGFLAMFASARGAIGCAASIRDATDELGLPVRVGIHTGEVELLPGDIGGVAVHVAARVMALGGPSEVMVSSSTHGLVLDSGLSLESRGTHELKGLPSPLEVFALID